MKLIYIALVLLLITACSPVPNPNKDLKANALISGPGITGILKATQTTNGWVWLSVDLQGEPKILTPGLHGVHFHEKASCQAQGEKPFSSAGGHFDPGPFGSSTPVEANHPFHLGDLPNIKINVRGKGRLEAFASGFTLADGPVSLFDSDGSAIIVHKLPDQRKAGGTAADAGGSRQACGVIQMVKS
jgi:Cu-Zn family superoxide dismutase